MLKKFIKTYIKFQKIKKKRRKKRNYLSMAFEETN